MTDQTDEAMRERLAADMSDHVLSGEVSIKNFSTVAVWEWRCVCGEMGHEGVRSAAIAAHRKHAATALIAAGWCDDFEARVQRARAEAPRRPDRRSRPMSDVTVTIPEASDIDAELSELQAFVLITTGHMPTVKAVGALRSRIAKALGHSDPWCVSYCRPGAKDSACGCRCGQHRKARP